MNELERRAIWLRGAGEALEFIGCADDIVMWSHQPNLLMSSRVFACSMILKEVSQLEGMRSVYASTDYSSAGNQRFRSPHIPKLDDGKVLSTYLPGSVGGKDRNKAACMLQFTSSVATKWDSLYQARLSEWTSANSGGEETSNDFFGGLAELPLSEVGEKSFEHDAGRLFAIPDSVVRASSIWRSVAKEAIVLALRVVSEARGSELDMLWWICPSCVGLKPSNIGHDGDGVYVRSMCSSCKTAVKTNLADFDVKSWLPKVFLCNIVDLLFAQPRVIVLYENSRVHFESTLEAVRLSMRMRVPKRIYVDMCGLKRPPGISNLVDLDNNWGEGRYAMRFVLDATGYGPEYIRAAIQTKVLS